MHGQNMSYLYRQNGNNSGICTSWVGGGRREVDREGGGLDYVTLE